MEGIQAKTVLGAALAEIMAQLVGGAVMHSVKIAVRRAEHFAAREGQLSPNSWAAAWRSWDRSSIGTVCKRI